MSDASGLPDLRADIDRLDDQLRQLLNQRASLAQQVARSKLAQDPNAVFYRPEREAQVLRRAMQSNEGPLSDSEIARLFREVMSACLALEQPLNIAFLGPAGTFTQAAALKHFGHSVQTVPLDAISDVFEEVESGNCHYGVVPVENSTEGVISHTLDMFMRSPLQICGEVALRIHHNLMADGASLDAIEKVYSHQQSLAQCRAWLDRHLPAAERIAVGSNAEAARLVKKEANSAAIGAEAAAELYELQVLASNIEDEAGNTTRFLVIGDQEVPPSGKDKTSLLLATRNEAGGLQALLTPLAEHGISMSRIESRPSRQGIWDYVFFVDLEGHAADEKSQKALQELHKKARLFKILGSYPVAVL
ncbi:MAG: prephenate dehydratase [gamma proteobacterium symbiont of Bathyaustriella thionipta]|nr:prephenate dehydratase [gamma proteobacterium symbiont of Bathyaustriella thionipta]